MKRGQKKELGHWAVQIPIHQLFTHKHNHACTWAYMNMHVCMHKHMHMSTYAHALQPQGATHCIYKCWEQTKPFPTLKALSPSLSTLQDHCPDCNDPCPYPLRKLVALICNSRDLCLQHHCRAVTWVQDEGFICLSAMGLLWLQTQWLHLTDAQKSGSHVI